MIPQIPQKGLRRLRQGRQELNRRTLPASRRPLPDGNRVIIYRHQCFALFTLLEQMEMTLSLEAKPAAAPWRKPASMQDDLGHDPKPDRTYRRPPGGPRRLPLTSEVQRF